MPPSSLLALLDANFNRAREAARVLEDQARFLLHDPALSKKWQLLRRSVGTLEARLGPLSRSRHVAADPGARDQAAPARNPNEIAAANARRLQEALRSLEEHLKAVRPPIAREAARLRFDAYEAQQAALHGPARRLAGVRLMALLTEALCRRPWLETARRLVKGGVDAIQLREKALGDREFLKRARALRKIAPVLILNDRVGLVPLCDADGVHVGEDDLSIADARALIGPARILGVTVHSSRDPVAGADYVSAGPVFVSLQKPGLKPAGLESVRRAVKRGMPFFAIGGITEKNLQQVIRAGATRVAVGTALAAADDPERAARMMASRLRQAGNR
ncbi:MAG: thiamine-phosphate [Planctomycetota bacterium]|nr:MAG: thiamine-phosphate [Planctomycetota bacterium]